MEFVRLVWTGIFLCICFAAPVTAETVPFLYTTDLFHPPDDPDDHFDLATLFALKELDVKGIVLDQGRDQGGRPGAIPVEQMNLLTGRKVPHVRGLAHPLRYPEDTGEDQAGGQEGPELILRVLRESTAKVTIMAVGSMRDVAAAYNRDPELYRQKVGRIYVVAGHSSGKLLEWNTALDPQSYLRLMKSNLPVYWVPCFSSNTWAEDQMNDRVVTESHQSFWSFRQSDVLQDAPPALQNFFLFALARIPPEREDPNAYLAKPVDAALREKYWPRGRDMWSTVAFYHAAGRRLQRHGDEWTVTPGISSANDPVYGFVPTRVLIDIDLRTTMERPNGSSTFQVLNIINLKNYQSAMASSLRQLLKDFPLDARYAARR